ncbi:MAG TPA: molybdenum cofactor guanylyltransferase MobA [Aquifex aeolicus]|nr:molybdenum cofactor guanylyltransferase MobA [Aquifex aeolicus]
MECYILAGGQSKRFGQDKLLYEIGKRKVIERVVEVAENVCTEVYLVAKKPEKFSFLNIPIIKDFMEISASIVGLYTALRNLKAQQGLILSGDIPLIEEKTLGFLIENYKPPITLIKTNQKLHTLVGIYSKKVLDELEKFIRNGDFRIHKFVKSIGFNELKLPISLEHTVLNMNTKEDLLKILEFMEKHKEL